MAKNRAFFGLFRKSSKKVQNWTLWGWVLVLFSKFLKKVPKPNPQRPKFWPFCNFAKFCKKWAVMLSLFAKFLQFCKKILQNFLQNFHFCKNFAYANVVFSANALKFARQRSRARDFLRGIDKILRFKILRDFWGAFWAEVVVVFGKFFSKFFRKKFFKNYHYL